MRREAGERVPVGAAGAAGAAGGRRRCPGSPIRRTPRAVVASIEQATKLAMAGAVGGVVTNPINKAALYQAGFAYPGHTEFLADLTGAAGQQIMMLASPMLRVVPVTVHASLRDSIAMLTTEMIVAAARTTAAALRRDFGIAAPRLAVAGLNPHAGEQGALGDRGNHFGAAGDRYAARGGDRCVRPVAAGHDVHRRRRGRATTWRSACITTRR